MYWLNEVLKIWTMALLWWAGFSIIFLILTKFMPCNPGRNWWTDRRAAITDFIYWLAMPFVNQLGRIALLVLGAWLIYGNQAPEGFRLRHWPVWLQCLTILLIQDFCMYWIHRLFHSRAAWKFHAIHHSSEVVDWTAAVRFHPVNVLAEFALVDVLVLLMGFSPVALIILGPINLIYSVMVHANLNWTFGPLKYIFASPVFHRWHHTSEEAGLNKNFAPTFPFIDLLAGTFYMPAELPQTYGVREAIPRGFTGQNIYPFRGQPVLTGVMVLLVAGSGYFVWSQSNRAESPQDVTVNSQPTETLRVPMADRVQSKTVTAVALTAKYKLIGFGDGTVIIQDLSRNTEIRLNEHAKRINAIAVNTAETRAATCSIDGTVRWWDLATGKLIQMHQLEGANIRCISLNTAGITVCATADGMICRWDATGEKLSDKSLGKSPIHAVAIDETGAKIAAAQTNEVTTWDITGDTLVSLKGIKNLPYALGFDRSGDHLAVGDYDGRLMVWNFGADRAAATTQAHSGPIYTVRSVGSDWLSGGADRVVRRWNHALSEPVEFHGHPGAIFAISVDPQTRRVMAVGYDLTTSHWQESDQNIVPASANR